MEILASAQGQDEIRAAAENVLNFLGHYPQEIFPRVLRNSRCREAIANIEGAIGGYEAIVSDFRTMGLVDLLEDDEPLDEWESTILESVFEAAKRLGELRPYQVAGLQDLELTLKRRLAQERDG